MTHPLVGGRVGDKEGLSFQGHQPGHSLSELEPVFLYLILGRSRGAPEIQFVGARLPEHKRAAFGIQGGRDRLNYEIEEGVDFERGVYYIGDFDELAITVSLIQGAH